ncbi:MAG: patatin [Robiginitomaculum sp.]|nr:MAG: patatin [Robiginitomaculum sp.]
MWYKKNQDFGLVLTGGGARGAYQVGVIKAVAELSEDTRVRFPVITGVSVGALNAVAVASYFDSFERSTYHLEHFWRSLRTHKVFDVRFHKMAFTGMRMLFSQFLPTLFRTAPKSLLDVEPLRRSLKKDINLGNIARSISEGDLHAVSVTCSGYSSGHAVTFFQAKPEILQWHRVRRDGYKCELTIDHVMASAALPLLFPAVKIEGEYFGDGALRLTSPLAPAIHLGANKLLIVGTRDKLDPDAEPCDKEARYPTLGDLGGYALDTLFHDSLDADIERLERINDTLDLLSQRARKKTRMEKIATLIISPSRDLREIALEFRKEMPLILRWMLRRQNSSQDLGRLESYLLFEPGYTGSLIDLGYADTMARADEVKDFLKGV